MKKANVTSIIISIETAVDHKVMMMTNADFSVRSHSNHLV